MFTKKIIVVEDQGVVALDIVYALHNAGFSNISLIGNSSLLHKKIGTEKPALVIADINKKNESDIIFCTEEYCRGSKIPFILIMGYPITKIEEFSKTARVTPILKPFLEFELIQAVKKVIKKV
jgi:DNA-binding NtrC family response regulator